MKLKKIITVLLCAAIITGCIIPSAHAEEEVIYISSEAELRSFAHSCKLDSYSYGKTVILCCDLDLSGKPFDPIGSLRGTFDGQGHTISGLELSSNGANQGFIRFVQSDGIVKNLNIDGSIAPTELRNAVGGIAGVNYGTISGCSFAGSVSGLKKIGGIAGENYGTISGCSASGKLIGKTATGGIAGYNKGLISNCANDAEVNTSIESNSLNVEELSISDLNTLRLVKADGENTVSDAGGIVGFSEGTVAGCTNFAAVGYKHFGYNIGGIAGRQSGCIENCVNNGEVYGKKDVGGICGQMEPYFILSQVESIADELNALSRALSSAMYHLSANAYQARELISDIQTDVDDAANNITNPDEPSEAPSLPPDENENNEADGEQNGGGSGDASENDQPDPDAAASGEASSGGSAPAAYSAPVKISRLKASMLLDDEAPMEPEAANETPAEEAPSGEAGDLPSGDSAAEEAPEPGDSAEEGAQQGDGAENTGGGSADNESAETADNDTENSGGDNESGDTENSGGSEDKESGGAAGNDKPEIIKPGSEIIENIINAEVYEKLIQALNKSMESIGARIDQLNGMFSGSIGGLADDLQSVNYHFARVSMLAVDLLNGQNLSLEDISELDSPELTDGKVFSCINNAAVYGDINVGGIAGDMGIEVEFDLDGNILDKFSDTSIARSSYETRCVVRSCTNKGSINGKKDYLGGITGYQELGYILDCSNFGAVSGEASTYVGGIAGYSNTGIDSSYAMCDITGDKFVGGICGSGYKIRNCISAVSFTKNAAGIGAIAGQADVMLYDVSEDYKPNSCLSAEQQAQELEKAKIYYIYNNIYVDDSYGAVDDLSYSDKAYPLSFEELMQTQQLPDNFKIMTASFFADDALVGEIDFSFGGSIDEDDIPPVPEKQGYTGYWPEHDYSKLSYGFSVEAVYEPNISSISSVLTRQDETLPLALLDGDFACGASIRLEEYTESSPVTEGIVLESWQLDIENNNYNSVEYTVHYKTPALGSIKNRLYIYLEDEDGLWQQAEYERHGSYLVFTSSGDQTRFAAVEAENDNIQLIAVCAAALLVLILIIIFVTRAKKKKKALKAK